MQYRKFKTQGEEILKKAFTIIELIITMVILSIVASITSGLIAKAYKGYNQTNSIHKANLKLEIALSSIVNRLEYAIDGTIVKRKSAIEIEIINKAPSDYSILEWVGYDKDGFEANNKITGTVHDLKYQPAWSGFCEIKGSTSTLISTPGSDLNFADEVIDILSNHRAGLTNNQVAVFFPGNYDYTNIGYINTGPDADGVGLIKRHSNNTFTLSKPIKRITEHYKLAWSAYAVVPKNFNATDNTFDLVLRYNFKPWNGEHYNSTYTVNHEKLLATNVTVFKTYATENRIHIKLCIKEKYGINKNASICKERVVFKW